jgi:hypothetical protein
MYCSIGAEAERFALASAGASPDRRRAANASLLFHGSTNVVCNNVGPTRGADRPSLSTSPWPGTS